MAYYELRYWKNFEQPDGKIIRLEIHSKGVEEVHRTAYEIGPVVQRFALDIQGQSEDIDAPIVKTSLNLTFVDAPDYSDNHPEAVIQKCGDWEELYTNDSTYWKVLVLIKSPESSSYTTLWGGYITPDSYSEELRYRGSVTFIVRDNIGHMQDFPFDAEGDAEGTISLRELVEEAWAKIESPMELYWPSLRWLECNGVYAFDTRMNISAFEGKNWYEAVEMALYSYGAAMRYIGENRVIICSLRYLPQQGRPTLEEMIRIEPIFVAHAQREFAPAVKRIEESVQYNLGEGVQVPLAKSVEFTGAANSCPFYSTNIFGETTKKNIPVHPIANLTGDGWSNPGLTLFFNPARYNITDVALREDVQRMLFLAGNTDGSHSVIYRRSICCEPFRIEMVFGRIVERFGSQVSYCYGFSSDKSEVGLGTIRVRNIDCYIGLEQDGETKFYDGAQWQYEPVRITLSPEDRKVSVDIGFKGIESEMGVLLFVIENIRIDAKWDYSDGDGMYVPIQSMDFVATDALSLCETNNVNTKYNETNNVIITRKPDIAPALNNVPFPNIIKNGIFILKDGVYLPAKEWAWKNGTPQQMAVYNHLQILCYHAKPNNLITGDIVNASIWKVAAIYIWSGAEHMLISGTYNYLNGRIESAVLREFQRYDDMWQDAPQTRATTYDNNAPEVEQNSKTVAEGSGQAGKTSTYRNETSVYLGEGGGGSIEVDSSLSTTSTNPVQNKVVTAALNDKISKANDVDHVMAAADGMVDSNDAHYYLPNVNPEDKQHTFAMLSDIPEGGEGGEGSPSAEEIYIGEEEPTDPNVKVWINPKEQGEGGGSAGGSGALRVWINEMTGGENNSEQVAENAETFKAMWNETPQMAILCAAAGLGGFPMMVASPVVVYRLISENGVDMISMAYRDIIDQGNGLEIMETYVYLKQDGTVTIEYLP